MLSSHSSIDTTDYSRILKCRREIIDFNLRIIRNTDINCVVIIQRCLILKQVVRTLSTMF